MVDRQEPIDFNFPGTPYSVQQQLMTALHSTIRDGKFGLFESPTGTGKTLSIICACLTWLKQNRTSLPIAVEEQARVDTAKEPEFVQNFWRKNQEDFLEEKLRDRQKAIVRRLDNIKSRNRAKAPRKPRQRSAPSTFDEYTHIDTDDENHPSNDRRANLTGMNTSVAPAKVIFATRTHTQLTQFLEEIRKTSFCSEKVLHNDQSFGLHLDISHDISSQEIEDMPLSYTLFGSRKQYCINEDVRALESSAAISERCRDLTENATDAPEEEEDDTGASTKRKRSKSKCVYKDKEAEKILRDIALVQMHSIEELVEAGKELKACPYFAARRALKTRDVDVIGVPYAAVLHEPTRKSLGLEIDQNTVVVFDEGHNVLNTVCDLHSATLTRPALVTTVNALKAYTSRYQKRFSPRNLFNLRQLLAIANGYLSFLPERKSKDQPKPRVLSRTDIVLEARIDHINIFELIQYIDESHVMKKLRGFVDVESEVTITPNSVDEDDPLKSGRKTSCKWDSDMKTSVPNRKGKPRVPENNNKGSDKVRFVKSAKFYLQSFENFIRCLTNDTDIGKPGSDIGRVALYPYMVPKTSELKDCEDESLPLEMTARLKYFVTEPASLFAPAVGNARAVLMLGGTLSPRTIIKDRLFSALNRGDVVEYECDHVVPTENLMTRICPEGPGGTPLEFTFRTRESMELYDELGKVLQRCCGLVPGGIVVFFASYDLMARVQSRLQKTGCLRDLEKSKPVFVESRGNDEAFNSFCEAIKEDKTKGALLAAVMGGRLSEGINFSDELGRMVLVVGMPFANARDVETAEVLRSLGSLHDRSDRLESECLTIVNQCIGRAVRHRKDYASIVLLDRRYNRDRVRNKLPAFVRRDVQCVNKFNKLEEEVINFFQRKR